MQQALHASPSVAHIDRAAEAVGMDRNLIPHCDSVAELVAFVMSVKAAGGDDKAINAFLDRFSPKASRNSTDVTINDGGEARQSANEGEEQSAAAYAASLAMVK